MKRSQNTRGYKRYLAMDIHREYILVGGQDEDQEWVLHPRRVSVERFPSWAEKNLMEGDIVILETTTNIWETYDIAVPFVSRVLVANAAEVGEIVGARVKTDKKDIERLLRLLFGGIVPEVWVPPAHVRELRSFISYRNRLVKTSTMIRNRLNSLLHKHNLIVPKGSLLDQVWWDEQSSISSLEKMQIRQELLLLAEVSNQKAAVDEELGRQSTGPVWSKQAIQLLQLPGVGVIVAMTVLSAIGDISRFENAKKLVGYAGLGTRVHDSGMSRRTGKITKAGRRDLRTAMAEAAQAAATSHPHWKAELARLEPRLGRNKAIVAIARKLLVVVWHVLTKETTDRFAEPEKVSQKLLRFAYQVGKSNRAGQSAAALVRDHLDELEIGQELTSIPWGLKNPIPLPPSRLNEMEQHPK